MSEPVVVQGLTGDLRILRWEVMGHLADEGQVVRQVEILDSPSGPPQRLLEEEPARHQHRDDTGCGNGETPCRG